MTRHLPPPVFTLAEVCSACRVRVHFVSELVDEGVLAPRGTSRDTWEFDARAVATVRRAHRLSRDLGVNTPGIALALELLERVETLQRSRLR